MTEYPFGDVVTIRLLTQAPLRLYVRIPSWATGATVSLNGVSAGAVAGTYHAVNCSAPGETVLRLDLAPQIRVERHWGLDLGC